MRSFASPLHGIVNLRFKITLLMCFSATAISMWCCFFGRGISVFSSRLVPIGVPRFVFLAGESKQFVVSSEIFFVAPLLGHCSRDSWVSFRANFPP